MCNGGRPALTLDQQPDNMLQGITVDEHGVDAYNAAQAELQRRRQLQSEMERIAAERTNTAAQQQAEMARLQHQQAQAAQDQAAQAAQLESQRQQQQQTLDQTRLATQSVAASMRVLQTQPTTKAPTAQTTRQRTTGLPRATSGSQSLRIGNTAAAPGVGMNIGG